MLYGLRTAFFTALERIYASDLAEYFSPSATYKPFDSAASLCEAAYSPYDIGSVLETRVMLLIYRS